MKNIFFRQIIFIPVLYVAAKLLWDLIPIEIFPDLLIDVMGDLFGPIFIMAIMILIFIYILWKIPVLGKLSQFLFGSKPNMQGTWRGQIKYEYEGKQTEKTVFLVVKQNSGYNLDIWLLTDERKSSSIFANIIEYKGGQRIIYTYSNEESPYNKDKNPSHQGFCQLDRVDASNILQGIYYTSRKTFGELSFDKKKRKITLDFERAKTLFGIKS